MKETTMPRVSIQRVVPTLAVLIAVGLLGFAAARSGTFGVHAQAGAEKFASAVRLAQAATDDNVTGYAWTDTIGWISFSGTNYGVNVISGATASGEGNIEGYAWSDNVGWISFNSGTPDDLAGCPGTVCEANFTLLGDGTAKIDGWAKVLADDTWISLNCETDPAGCAASGGTDYGITVPQISCDWGGYAWSEQYGWISFSGAGYGVSGLTGTAACTSEEAVGEESVTIINLNTSTNGGTVTIVMRVEDETGASIPPNETATPHTTSVTADVDGGTPKNMTYDDSVPGEEKYTASFTGLSDGTHTANVSATDSRDLSDSDAAQFTIDTTAPPPEPSPDPGNPPPPDGGGGSFGNAEITNGIISATRSKFPEAETGDTIATITWDIDWGNNGGLDTSEGDFCRVESVNGSASASLNSVLAGLEDQQAGLVELAMDDTNGDGVPEETTYQLDCTDFENDRNDRYDLENNDGDKPSVTVGVEYNSVEIDPSFGVSPRNLSVMANGRNAVEISWGTNYADVCYAQGDWAAEIVTDPDDEVALDNAGEEIGFCGPSYTGSGSCDVTTSGGETFDFQLLCQRIIDGSVASQQTQGPHGVSITQPSFAAVADPASIDTTTICQGNAPVNTSETFTINFTPHSDFTDTVRLQEPSLTITDGPTNPAWVTLEGRTYTSGGDVYCDGGTCDSSIDATVDLRIKCLEQGSAIIEIEARPDGGGDSGWVNFGLNVQTFTPRFEEF